MPHTQFEWMNKYSMNFNSVFSYHIPMECIFDPHLTYSFVHVVVFQFSVFIRFSGTVKKKNNNKVNAETFNLLFPKRCWCCVCVWIHSVELFDSVFDLLLPIHFMHVPVCVMHILSNFTLRFLLYATRS